MLTGLVLYKLCRFDFLSFPTKHVQLVEKFVIVVYYLFFQELLSDKYCKDLASFLDLGQSLHILIGL